MSRLQRLQLDGSKFNLITYRQVIKNQPLIQVQLELMHVFALWMQVLAVTMGSGTSNQPISKEDSIESMQNAYADVTNWEHKLLYCMRNHDRCNPKWKRMWLAFAFEAFTCWRSTAIHNAQHRRRTLWQS